jgi:ADP-heptose:LPS heptosyltransferase
MSRFFFDRTHGLLRTSEMMSQAADTSSLDPAAPGPDKLFDDCARLPLPSDLIKRALADLSLRTLGKNEKRLVVHPGSGGRAKRWPLPSFIEVIRRAASLGLGGVLVTGEAEADLEAALKALALPAGWTRVSRLPAETLAGLLAGSTHYLGNDSGPTHLAAACGVSVLALFREDSLPAWRPFGKAQIIAAPSMSGIPPEAVLVALDGFFAL